MATSGERTVGGAIDLALCARWGTQKDGERTYVRALDAAGHLPKGGDTRLSDLGPANLRDVARGLKARGLSHSSVNRHMAALRGALRVAVEEGWIDAVPPWRALREPPGRLDIPTMEQVGALIRGIQNGQAVLIARLLAETGLRLSEALALTPEDILEDRVLVRDSKSGHGRVVPFFPLPKDALPGWSDSLYSAGCFVRYGAVNGKLSARFVLSQFAEARKREGLPDFVTPHSLRHFHATRLAEAGVPVPTIANILGHRSWRTTMRYVHATPGALRDAVETVRKKEHPR